MGKKSSYLKGGVAAVLSVLAIGRTAYLLMNAKQMLALSDFSLIQPANQYYAEVDTDYVKSILNGEN